jgi:hypothetical protein
MKVCYTCKGEKDKTEFNKNCSRSDGLQSICKECDRSRSKALYYENNYKIKMLERRKVRRQEKRLFIINYLKEHPCIDCGETDPLVLDFDHINPKEKFKSISSMISNQEMSWELIKTEINKCEIRCANCHRRKTAVQFGWNIVGLLAEMD